MKSSHNTTPIVQNINSYTFYYKRDQKCKKILFIFLKNNKYSFDEYTFQSVDFSCNKPVNFCAKVQIFDMSLRNFVIEGMACQLPSSYGRALLEVPPSWFETALDYKPRI